MSLFGKPVPATAQSLIDAQISVNNLREARTTQADPVAVILKEFECEVTLREYDDAQQMGLYQNVLSEHGRSGRYTRHDARAMAAEILRLREALKQPVQDERPWQYGVARSGRDYRVRMPLDIEERRGAVWVPTGLIAAQDVELVASLIAKTRQPGEKP